MVQSTQKVWNFSVKDSSQVFVLIKGFKLHLWAKSCLIVRIKIHHLYTIVLQIPAGFLRFSASKRFWNKFQSSRWLNRMTLKRLNYTHKFEIANLHLLQLNFLNFLFHLRNEPLNRFQTEEVTVPQCLSPFPLMVVWHLLSPDHVHSLGTTKKGTVLQSTKLLFPSV